MNQNFITRLLGINDLFNFKCEVVRLLKKSKLLEQNNKRFENLIIRLKVDNSARILGLFADYELAGLAHFSYLKRERSVVIDFIVVRDIFYDLKYEVLLLNEIFNFDEYFSKCINFYKLKVNKENEFETAAYRNLGFIEIEPSNDCLIMEKDVNYKAPDLYFRRDYGRLYEEVENAKALPLRFISKYGEVLHQVMIREIPEKIDEITYFDLVTPYGYGGPLIIELKGGVRELAREFERYFEFWCKKNKIVSEFIRFHPVIGNHRNFEKIYAVQAIRKTVGTKIVENTCSTISSKARQNARKFKKLGGHIEVVESPSDLDDFLEIYYNTMKRQSANRYYFFNKGYFKQFIRKYCENIIIVKAVVDTKVVAMDLNFFEDSIVQYHLGGTLKDYLNFSPAEAMKIAIINWAKKKGLKVIFYGGGLTNAEDDRLLRFKKKFGNELYDFYIGRKIWNQSIYNELVERTNTINVKDFFPKYRAKM
jgi:hypothetical protein